MKRLSSCRGQVLQTGLLDGTAFTSLHSSNSEPMQLLKSALVSSKPSSGQPIPQTESAPAEIQSEEGQPASGAEATVDAQAEIEKLKQQLLEAQEAAMQWRNLHAELHQFCVDRVLATAQT
jgi:hypothetical protein